MTFIRKYRSEGRTKTIAAEYECEEHGRFELDVERNDAGDAPDVIQCPIPIAVRNSDGEEVLCSKPCEWRISAPLTTVRRVEAIKGKSQKPERKTWTDTTAVGEGQPLYDWWEDRAKIWEEKRKEDVMAFAREVHERPIGGD